MGPDYRSAFQSAVDRVRDEGRYRVFADLKRRCGDFPRATWTRDDGSQRDINTEFITAAVMCIALALIADALLAGSQRVLTPWTRRRR